MTEEIEEEAKNHPGPNNQIYTDSTTRCLRDGYKRSVTNLGKAVQKKDWRLSFCWRLLFLLRKDRGL
jgi:hypothetical protein